MAHSNLILVFSKEWRQRCTYIQTQTEVYTSSRNISIRMFTGGGLCNISPLSSDGNIFDTEIPIHFLWTKYLLIQMLNSNWRPSSIFYLLSAWLYRRKHKFFQPFFSSSFSLYKLSSVYHTFAQHRIISRRYSRLFEFHNERSGT